MPTCFIAQKDREPAIAAPKASTAKQDQAAGQADKTLSPQMILDAFGIEVIGETENQSILCWVKHTKKRWTIKSPAGSAD